MDEKVLSKVISGGHDVFASESSVVFYFDISFNKNEQSSKFESVELHFVELEGVLFQKSQYFASCAVSFQVLVVFTDFFSVDKTRVYHLLS